MSSTSKRSNKKGRNTPHVNVTPLVDIVLVLLIIFMVISPMTPAMLSARLPPKDAVDQSIASLAENDTPLLVAIDQEGQFSIQGIKIDQNELTVRLKKLWPQRKDKLLYIEGHDSAPYAQILAAMDFSRDAGAHPIVMKTTEIKGKLPNRAQSLAKSAVPSPAGAPAAPAVVPTPAATPAGAGQK